MSWKDLFSQAIASVKEDRHREALEYFTEALQHDGEKQYMIYDSRAAVFEVMDKPKDALRDAMSTIDHAPDRWEGYARAARLFFRCLEPESALVMVDMALERLTPNDAVRRVELSHLKAQIRKTQKAEESQTRAQNHTAKLPHEIFAEIFRILVSENRVVVPSTLRNVCAQWRGVAENIPSLWDTLVLTGRWPAAKACVWIACSKGKIRELCVRASAAEVYSDWEKDLVSMNWDNLRVCKVELWDIVRYLSQIGKLEVLSTLDRIEVDDRGKRVKVDRSRLFVKDSQLRHLALDNTTLVSWQLSLARLTTLVHLSMRVELPTAARIAPILEQNPYLESLKLNFGPVRYISIVLAGIEIKAAHLPRLTRLELTNTAFAGGFLQKLVMPELQVLHITRCPLLLDTGLLTIAASGVTRLTELAIRRSTVHSWPVIQVLQASPQLQVLELTQVTGMANEVLEVLAQVINSCDSSSTSASGLPSPAIEQKFVCPSLTRIDLTGCRDLKTGPLVRLIKSRLPSPEDATEISTSGSLVESESAPPSTAPISSLTVNCCPEVDSEWLPWFKKNVRFFSCIYISMFEAIDGSYGDKLYLG